MRTFYDVDYIGTDIYLGISIPGITIDANNQYNFFAQSEPVIRLTQISAGQATNIEWDITCRAGQPDQFNVSTRTSINNSLPCYMPLGDIVRMNDARPEPPTTSPLTYVGSPMVIKIMALDASNNLIASIGLTGMGCDGGSSFAFEPNDQRAYCIPDTFRGLYMGASVRVVVPEDGGLTSQLKTYFYNNTASTENLLNTGLSKGVKYPTQGGNRPVFMKMIYSNGYEKDIRWEWYDCSSDKITLVWYSPLVGGWKSAVCWVVGNADTIDERKNYIVNFDKVTGYAANDTLRLKMPMLTYNDFLYYRDIMWSDDVKVGRGDIYKPSIRADVENNVRITGTMPEWRLNDVKDFTFDCQIQSINTL